MTGQKEDAETKSRLDLLLQMLQSDRDNLTLLTEAIEAALDERRPEVANDLLDRASAITPLSPRQVNLAGLAAMQSRRFDEAADLFEQLLAAGVDDVNVRFNVAWSRAMLKDFDGALNQLDDKVARALPQAAALEVQILHQQGALKEASEKALTYMEIHPDDAKLMAAISVLALDMEDSELAARCARKGGNLPDALTTLGTLALDEDQPGEALDIFNRVITQNEHVPRAWVGRGLAKLLTGDAKSAATDIDRGAEMFGSHLGSWIAAGWAHFIRGDLASSRARFETALNLDPTFAENYGSLAVLDILDGRIEEGRSRCQIALRLDRNCYSGALAQVLLAANAGDQAGARRIFDLAVNSPFDESGRTLAQALARLGIRG